MNRLGVIGLVAVLSVGTVACIPPEPDDDLIVQYDPAETVMGEIQERGDLRIGVPVDRPPFAQFAFDLGSLVARALDVRPTLVPLEYDRILDAPENQQVDISFPTIATTERLVRRYAVTDPYYIAHQRLLVPEDSGIERVGDIDGVVCQYIDPRVGVNIVETNPDAHPITPANPSECIQGLRTGDVAAVTAADWLALPLLVENGGLDIVGEQMTTEAYGAVLETGASAWTDFVSGVLAEAGAEGDWQRYYNRAFNRYVDEAVVYPDMTVEEAAALYPRDI